MSGIFINYRREDSQQLAGRLLDRLAQRFGTNRVFRDIDAIDPGAKFAEVIAERIGECDALVALIGTGWLDAKDVQGRRRLDLPNDVVKAEIAEALAQNKLVIPMLIESTPMPDRDALPAEIAAMADCKALPVSDSRFDFDVGRLISAICKVLAPDERVIASPDLWTLVQDCLRRRGFLGLVVLACGGIWWQWDHISKLPGIEPLVTRITEQALPKAVPGKFNVAVAHLEGDDERETERLIIESLREFPSVATLSFDRLVSSEQGDSVKAEREGHERARTLLESSGADVLIWGVLLKEGSRSVPKLYWTPAREVAQSPSAGRYHMTESLSLPAIFWQDLTNVLGLLVATSGTEFAAQRGQYRADKLAPFVQRVRGLLQSSQAEQWSAATHAQVMTILGTALTTYGDQSGQNELLREAVATYREALKEYTREKVPLDWAKTQDDLGTALRTLGERESDPARLTEAVAAFHGALKVRTRQKVPLDWAETQNDLGGALLVLGQRESDPTRLTEAVAAFREALKEYTREKVPRGWAATQNNLGIALTNLGDRESNPARLAEALVAYREALKEYTREKVPLDWAMTQNNLGNALLGLGRRESDPVRFREAVDAFREALEVRTREKVPLDWAATQNNLGNALQNLGRRESDPARLREAVTAFREALKERTREKVPLDWAVTQNNLGVALETLGERESDGARLEEAAEAYEAALPVVRLAKADHLVDVFGRNLQRVQKEISQRKKAKGKVRANTK